jgi:sorbitol-specific phosphotransferase system component IIA
VAELNLRELGHITLRFDGVQSGDIVNACSGTWWTLTTEA